MDYKIERLNAENYDELLTMLNTVFHKSEGDTFDIFLPVMWKRDDAHMSKHLAIRANGKLAAVVGIYPLPAIVGNEPITFATIGNVATLPEFEGQGMMRALMDEALKEAKRLGIDVARLSGARQRYNRYGFERAGIDYEFKLTQKNLMDYYRGTLVDGEVRYVGSFLSKGESFERKFRFKQILLDDKDLLDHVMTLERYAPLYTERGDAEQFFQTLSAYKCKIWGALNSVGELVGYICATDNGSTIYEHRANHAQNEYQMLLDWMLEAEVRELTIHTAPWECELNMLLEKICEKWGLTNTNMFCPFNWSKLLNALLKIKAKYTHIPSGSLIIQIEGYGTIEMSADCCVDTNKLPQITLSHLDAVRFLLGIFPPTTSYILPESLDERSKLYLQSVLPLPLWWCNQDRV